MTPDRGQTTNVGRLPAGLLPTGLALLLAVTLAGLAVLAVTHPGATWLSPFRGVLAVGDGVTVLREGAWHAYRPQQEEVVALREALRRLRPWDRLEVPPGGETYFLYFGSSADPQGNQALDHAVRYRAGVGGKAVAAGSSGGDWYLLGPLSAAILSGLARHFDAAGYGELVAWPALDQMFVPGTTATIVDLATGRSLQVRRREVMTGLYHADVEPLTAEDTARLASLVHGTWSWDRRAVVLQLGDRRIAASIHTMPHGGHDIGDNNFPGHFCLHALGSWTHVGLRIDPEHLLRVLEAAGQGVVGGELLLPEGLAEAGPGAPAPGAAGC